MNSDSSHLHVVLFFFSLVRVFCFPSDVQYFVTFKNLLGNYNKELKRLSTRLLARLEEDRENALESAHLAESSGSD